MARKKRPKVPRKPKKGRAKVIAPSKRKEWRTDGITLLLSASDIAKAVVDGVEGSGADGVLTHHSKAFAAGVRSNTWAPLPPVTSGQARREIDAGKRPDLRGVTRKKKGLANQGAQVVSFFPRSPTGVPNRSKIVVSTPRRSPLLSIWMVDEYAKHGIEYFNVDGLVEQVVDRNLRALLEGLVD